MHGRRVYTGSENRRAQETPSMNPKALVGVLAAGIAVMAIAQAATAGQSSRSAPRMPWGDPDISGLFTTDDELGVPFERPVPFGDRQLVTAEEFNQRQAQAERQ